MPGFWRSNAGRVRGVHAPRRTLAWRLPSSVAGLISNGKVRLCGDSASTALDCSATEDVAA
jgi:hypothetical protein